MPYSDEREYRAMNIAVRAPEEGEEGNKIVEGYATTFNQRYELYSFDNVTVYESVEPTAFIDCDMSDVIMQYDHRGRVFARNSNGTLKLSTDEHGLKVTADLAGTQMGRDLYEEIRGGYTDKMSFGFTIREKSREITENEDGTVTVWQRINKVKKLYDVSAVSIPANPNTNITSLTRTADINGEIEEVRKEIAARRERNKERERLALRLKLLEVSNNDN